MINPNPANQLKKNSESDPTGRPRNESTRTMIALAGCLPVAAISQEAFDISTNLAAVVAVVSGFAIYAASGPMVERIRN